jgi:hypothetical protein
MAKVDRLAAGVLLNNTSSVELGKDQKRQRNIWNFIKPMGSNGLLPWSILSKKILAKYRRITWPSRVGLAFTGINLILKKPKQIFQMPSAWFFSGDPSEKNAKASEKFLNLPRLLFRPSPFHYVNSQKQFLQNKTFTSVGQILFLHNKTNNNLVEMLARGELRSLWVGVLIAVPSGAGPITE